MRMNEKGFTLVETLAVLAIIAIMAAAAAPMMTGFIEDAKKKTYISEASVVLTAVQAYMLEEYAANGTVDAFDFYDKVSASELGSDGCPLNDLLDGSYTEGSRITEIYLDGNSDPPRIEGIKYLVKGFYVEIRIGKSVKVTKAKDGK